MLAKKTQPLAIDAGPPRDKETQPGSQEAASEAGLVSWTAPRASARAPPDSERPINLEEAVANLELVRTTPTRPGGRGEGRGVSD